MNLSTPPALLAATALFLAAGLPPLFPVAPAAAAPGDSPDRVDVADLRLVGETCTTNSAYVRLSNYRTELQITHTSLTAEAGLVTDPHDGSQSWRPEDANGCAVSLSLRYPAGWRVALAGTRFFYSYNVAGGATASVRLGARVADGPPHAEDHEYRGPASDLPLPTRVIADPHFSPCGATTAPLASAKHFTVRAHGTPPTSRSEVTADISPTMNYDTLTLRWERC